MAAVGNGDLSAATVAPSMTPVETKEVADAVLNIVDQTLQLGFLREGCATLLVAQIEGRSAIDAKSDPLAISCRSYFDETARQLKVDNEFKLALLRNVDMLTAKKEGVALVRDLIAPLKDAKELAEKLPPPRPVSTPSVAAQPSYIGVK